MKLIAGLASAGLLALATHSVESSATARGATETSSNAASAAAVVPASLHAVVKDPAPPPVEQRWLRAGAPNKIVLIPSDVCQSAAPYDVLVHFHGVSVSTEPSLYRSKLHAVAVIVNWGIGSGAYEDKFQAEGSLSCFLDGLAKTVQRACRTETGQSASSGVGRVALSAWSAGYGAIYRILFHEKDAALVDSVLLADGLHAGYAGYHQVNGLQMEGFAKFADLAARGDKLFAISHSEVKPYKYASTEETADFLLDHEHLARTLTDEPGPRPKMHLTSKADRNGFHVRGFSGDGLNDHSQHLHGIGDNLWSLLRERWSTKP